MSEIITNLSTFAAGGFRFPDHTVFIWSAYGASFLILLLLFILTQRSLAKEKAKAKARLEG